MRFTLKFRKATMDDANQLLAWKNESEVRQWSIVSQDRINMLDHLKWLEQNLKRIRIITDGERDYGDVRVYKGEIAIKICKSHRGKGIGSWALGEIKKHYKRLYAKVVDGNVKSMRLFINSGFKVTQHRENYYILTYERK